MTNLIQLDFDLGAGDHHALVSRDPSGDIRVSCLCSATWTHKATETEDQIRVIHAAHLKYFNRPKLETL